ncbi:hypothetical protein OIO90_000027 [Microbotryomycetes sp. JL221]|nr:hypothetical protein OIO90_000027 [Microbotryomycetes sp. JL221]
MKTTVLSLLASTALASLVGASYSFDSSANHDQLHRRMSRRLRTTLSSSSSIEPLSKRQQHDGNGTLNGLADVFTSVLDQVGKQETRKKNQEVLLAAKHKKEQAAKKKAEKAAAEAAAAQAAAEAAAKKQAEEQAAKKAAAEQAEAERKAAEKAAARAAKKEANRKAKEAEEARNRSGGGLFGFSDDKCGDSGASDDYPNGSQSFLNCGISKRNGDSGWTPPHVTLDQIKTVSLDEAINSGGPFSACSGVLDTIDKVASEVGLPAILLASIAMQESSCNPDTVGGAGESGLFQITQDKCGNAPGGNCMDVWYNTHTAATYLKSNIDNAGGNILVALGEYNGWWTGMSYNFATQYAGTDQCRRQNNLDYIFSLLNGWLLNKGKPWEMGEYHNLASCF